VLRWRWGALLAISLASGAACSTDDGRFTVLSSPGREVVLVGEQAHFGMHHAVLDHGELIFWRHLDRSRADVVAAILDTPFGANHSPRFVELSERPHEVIAAADSAGRICLARLRYDEGGLTTVTASLSGDRGVSWSEPRVVYREEGELVVFDPDSLVPGRPGEWYLLLRYRTGKTPKGLLFRVYRYQADQWVLRGFVPETDDLSLFDSASLGVSNDGQLAVAFVTYAGALRVLESADGGQTWMSLGAPARLRVPGIRIPFISIPPRVTERMPSLGWIDGGWTLAWEAHVATHVAGLTWDTHVDTLFARHDRAAGKWTATVRVNDRRTVVRTTTILNTSGGMEHWEMIHREARGTDLRRPHLAAAASGRLAIFWTELRDEQIVPVASVSIDGGSSWSRPLVLDATHRGDSDRVRGGFDSGGNLVAVYLAWPGQTSLRAAAGMRLKAAEVLLR